MALKDSFIREVLPYLMTTWISLTVLINTILGILTINFINKKLSFTQVAKSFTIQFLVIDVIADVILLIPSAVVSTTLSWIMTDIGCQIYGVATMFVYLVIFHILALRCFERVVRIKHQELHGKLFSSPRRLAVLSFSVWFVDLLISGIPLTGWTTISYDYYHSGCFPVLEDNLYHLIIVKVLGIGLALIFFIISHVVIFNSINSQTNMSRIQPVTVKERKENEESPPRTSSQNWIHESESSDNDNFDNDGQLTNRNSHKFGISSFGSRNKQEYNHFNEDKSNHRQYEINEKNKMEIREKMTRKQILFAMVHSVFTHFGVCLFMIIFWMPYFIVTVCRTVDKDVFRGYYSVSLCFILLTFTMRPLVHYVRLRRLIKNRQRNVLQWRQEIIQEKKNVKHTDKHNRKETSDGSYISTDESYDEESSIGFNDDESERKDIKGKHPKRKIMAKPGKTQVINNTPNNQNRNESPSQVKKGNNHHKKRRRIRKRKKVKQQKQLKGIPVLNKRNIRSYDSESEYSEWSEYTVSEDDTESYIDDSLPIHGNEVARKVTDENQKAKEVLPSDQSSKHPMSNGKNEEVKHDQSSHKEHSEQKVNQRSRDESSTDVGTSSVHLVLASSTTKYIMSEHKDEIKGKNTEVDQNKRKENDLNHHIDDKSNSESYKSKGKGQKDHEYKQNSLNGVKEEEEETTEHRPTIQNDHQETMNQANSTWADKSHELNSKIVISTVHYKALPEELPRSKSDMRRVSETIDTHNTQTYPRHERRKTHDTLDTKKVYQPTPKKQSFYNQYETNEINSREQDERNTKTKHTTVLLTENQIINTSTKTEPKSMRENNQIVNTSTKTEPKSMRENNQIINTSPKTEPKSMGEKQKSVSEPKSEKQIIKEDSNNPKEDNKSKTMNQAKYYNVPNRNHNGKLENDQPVFVDQREMPFGKDTDHASSVRNNGKANKTLLEQPENIGNSNTYSSPHDHNLEKANLKVNKSEKYHLKKTNNQDDSVQQRNPNEAIMKQDDEESIQSAKPKGGNQRIIIPTLGYPNSALKYRARDKEKTHFPREEVGNRNRGETGGPYIGQQNPEQHLDVRKNKAALNTVKSDGESNTTHNDNKDMKKANTDTQPIVKGLITDLPENKNTKDNTSKQVNYQSLNSNTNPQSFYHNSDDNNERKAENKHTKQPHQQYVPDSKSSMKNVYRKHADNDNIDLSNVFINSDELPNEYVPVKSPYPVQIQPQKNLSDEKTSDRENVKTKPSSLSESKPDEKQRKETETTGMFNFVASLKNPPRQTLDIYDADEAAPLSSRSLDSKPSHNWYKAKAKVSSYVAMSKKDKFSTIHGEDNIYDRSGAREVSISHIKDDKQWKSKLADVHLM